MYGDVGEGGGELSIWGTCVCAKMQVDCMEVVVVGGGVVRSGWGLRMCKSEGVCVCWCRVVWE